MTLSILALDEREQVVGAAVTSCVLAAARRVLHVRPGVGAVAAQAGAEITWGPDILDELEAGCSVDGAVDPYRKRDTQVAAITELLPMVESLAAQHPSDLHLTRALAAARQPASKK